MGWQEKLCSQQHKESISVPGTDEVTQEREERGAETQTKLSSCPNTKSWMEQTKQMWVGREEENLERD